MPALIAWIEARLREDWSPEQIAGSAKAAGMNGSIVIFGVTRRREATCTNTFGTDANTMAARSDVDGSSAGSVLRKGHQSSRSAPVLATGRAIRFVARGGRPW
jgi:hypothetical protein